MQRFFMSRRSAIALIVQARTAALAHHEDRLPAEVERQQALAGDLTRLLFDVRAGRVSEFELKASSMHVTVASD
ncbi:hypothetical protein C7399_11194 [Paraburkholderia tropica]|uniref:Uncharacterized protein n=2 Tax=Burkholderiaceae TaxID=119060 RepID=A0AAQ1JUL9_9BURK|nr:hypothetical protein C7400_11193 [Paraburkholderia tropica]PZW80129.1 hypothetical protein C7399_11194 [Paraburkholderia tropica]SEJ79156.1 hypothetical protein SAMN05216550_108295 [Paraburkholderia tropica]